MHHPTAFLIVLWVLIAGCEAQRVPTGQPPPPTPAQSASLPSESPRIPDVLSVPPESMRQALAEAYRLRPDRRFLLAAVEIHHLLTGEPKAIATVEFKDARWQVRYADAEVGALPPFPDFRDFVVVLADWARRVHDAYPQGLSSTGAASPVAEFDGQINRFAAPELFGALRQMDRAWKGGSHDPALFPSATRALVLLTLQSLDRAEMGDEVPAKALALLVLTKTFTNQAAVREEALLARVMGYAGYAATLASSLPPSDAVRLYLTGDDRRLKAVAEAAECPVETRYLWLLRLAEQRDVKGFYSFVETYFQQPEFILPRAKAGLDMHDFGSNRSLSEQLPDWIHGELAQEVGKSTRGWRRTLGETVPRVIIVGIYLIDSLVRQVFGLDPPGPSAPVHQVTRAVAHLFAWAFGTGLSAAIDRFDSGLEAAAGKHSGPFLDPDTYRAYYRGFFYSGLFVRGLHYVEDRLSLASVSNTALYDLALVETLHRSAFETAPSSWYAVWYANFTGNQKLQLELLRWPSLTPETRAQILGHLEKQAGAKGDFLRAEYRRLIDEKPEGWSVREMYVEYLERIKDHETARAIIDEWLKNHDESAGFDHIFPHTALARIYYREGRYEEGWEAIEPVVESWQVGAMEWAAQLLDKLKRPDDAEAMGRRVVSRYPDSPRSRAKLAEMYWQHGKNAEAAKLLKGPPRNLSITDWQHIVAPRFADVFKDRPDDGLAAFGALLAEGLDHYNLHSLPYPLGKAGKPELAFRIAIQLHSQGLGQIEIFIQAYRHLKDWRGKEVALDWLRKNVPVPMHNPSSLVIFSLGEYGLLWDLIENPEQGSHQDAVWLMRAAASAKMGPGKDPHRDALLKHYGSPGGSHYHALGRFLLGLQTEGEVLSLATDVQKRCEIAFYAGLRAQTEGRYVDASDWYRVTVETGQERNGEYRWALDTLYRWAGEGKSLSRLAAEKL